jgi:hypothetical protein
MIWLLEIVTPSRNLFCSPLFAHLLSKRHAIDGLLRLRRTIATI